MQSSNKLKIAWLATILLLVTASLSPGSKAAHAFSFDILFHIGAYALLSAIPIIVFRKRLYASITAIAIAPLAFLFETIHGSITGYGFEMLDALYNNIGILIGFICGIFIRLRQHFDNKDKCATSPN